MAEPKFKTPVLFLVFNRPSSTQLVFDTIRQAQPSRLYIVADGPRKNKVGEAGKCMEVRSIVSNVDWECDVKKIFREDNWGCGKSVSSAITWFFENEPEGIILEDDCVPDPTFFPYCSALLEHYREDTRIMEVSGCNIWPSKFCQDEYSYSFSAHNGIWGWASWRRAWNLYDFEMKHYKEMKTKGYLKNKFGSIFETEYFNWVFERTYLFPYITWDYQWEFVKRINTGLTIIPQKNLVVNIGFGADATSTTNPDAPSHKLKSEKLRFPLQHPPFVMANKEADKQAFIDYMTNRSTRFKSYVKNVLPVALQKKLFKHSMLRFMESQETDPVRLEKLKEKKTF